MRAHGVDPERRQLPAFFCADRKINFEDSNEKLAALIDCSLPTSTGKIIYGNITISLNGRIGRTSGISSTNEPESDVRTSISLPWFNYFLLDLLAFIKKEIY